MARKVEVLLVDDIDGGAAAETVNFALDGTAYEIDLSAANAGALRDEMARFVAAARKAGKSPRTARTRTAGESQSVGANRQQNHAIREWAKTQGFDVNVRGRIPTEIVEKYRASIRG
ncbi:histone-like nucleoid-structuring protein Lsr2 [Cryptosporangium phraense]|uniref:Lsr2 family protein n=1 Tax=Cryptosporangium phraense TaxID=2593070 RepID=A0A545ANL0_9ACTN|nr:Lsr2 family protein [Cryptosporangium phraense]TQS42860.1 Lsr2 family protein [Cryptosporangium phraense]